MKKVNPARRLLPWTICAMGALLVVKSVSLVRAAVPGGAPVSVVAPARAEAAAKPTEAAAKPTNAALKPGEAAPPAGPAPGSTPVATPSPAARPSGDEAPVSDSERALLLALRQRRSEIEARDAALTQREAVLAAAETRLGARVEELTSLQRRIEALEAARKDRDEANWRGLVKLYETMKPRDAATIFNDLEMPVLLQVVDRMKESKAAPVLAAMQPDRARLLTAELAQMRAHLNTAAAADRTAPTPTSPPPTATATDGKGKT